MRLKSGFGPLAISSFVISWFVLISVSHSGSAFSILGVRRIPPTPQKQPLPSSPFQHRTSSAEDESEEENESQARVEPQITPLNRDECLAKLLCGMSVPVTGSGAPKNGYYSEYANIVAKFFEAFPLDEEEKSIESIEAYDDYSAEDKPARVNSKVMSKKSGGLQLIDLAVIKESSNTTTNSDKFEDDERNARKINKRIARARKIVSKLGEKLQTVRQCQQLTGCPFTFKQLRSKLKNIEVKPAAESFSKPKPKPATSEIANDFNSIPPIKYTYSTNGYKPSVTKTKLSSTEVTLGTEPHADTQKGDDELEEFFGPPPVFGANGRPIGQHNRPATIQQKKQHQQQQQQQMLQQSIPTNEQYVPYQPPVKYGNSKAQVHSGSAFPVKKVYYKVPSLGNKRPVGENDEFDDVNQSTGPISLISEDENQKVQFQFVQEDEENQKGTTATEGASSDDGSDEEYEDDDGEDEEEYDEEEESDEDEEEQPKKKKNNSGAASSVSDKFYPPTESETTTKKTKIQGYKNPNKESLVFIESEFPTKKDAEDDELDHPENAWTKLAFATSAAVVKESKVRNKTALEEKNDEKLHLSKESSKEDSNESEGDEEEDEDAEVRSEQKLEKKPFGDSDDDEAEEEKSRSRRRRRPTKNSSKSVPKLSLDDEEEFDKVTAAFNKSKAKKEKKKKTSNKSRNSHKQKKKQKQKKEKKPPLESVDEGSAEEQAKNKPEPILEIGGRPMVPNPSKQTQQTKKVGGLSRFKFSLIRPYGISTKEENAAETYQQSSSKVPNLPPYSKSPSSNSFRRETVGSSISSSSSSSSTNHAAPQSGSFGVPMSGSGSSSSPSHPSLITFPFARPLSTFKTLFNLSGSKRREVPTHTHQSHPISPFVYRPIGPESNQFKREGPPDRSRSDMKEIKSKKGSRSRSRSGISSSSKGKKNKSYRAENVKSKKTSSKTH